jgi:hypothetical protein
MYGFAFSGNIELFEEAARGKPPMTAQILTLHPQQGQTRCHPSLACSPRSATLLWRTIRRIVETVGWVTVMGLILGHMP